MAKSGMVGPIIELRIVDASGNVLKAEGKECTEEWEFSTLDEALEAFEDGAAELDDLYGTQEQDDLPPDEGIGDGEEEEDEENE